MLKHFRNSQNLLHVLISDWSTSAVRILVPCFHSDPQLCHWKWPLADLRMNNGIGLNLRVHPDIQKELLLNYILRLFRPAHIYRTYLSMIHINIILSMPITKHATCFYWFIAWFTLQTLKLEPMCSIETSGCLWATECYNPKTALFKCRNVLHSN
jgi:hypothetical protein